MLRLLAFPAQRRETDDEGEDDQNAQTDDEHGKGALVRDPVRETAISAARRDSAALTRGVGVGCCRPVGRHTAAVDHPRTAVVVVGVQL